jgi:hypothetical protein
VVRVDGAARPAPGPAPTAREVQDRFDQLNDRTSLADTLRRHPELASMLRRRLLLAGSRFPVSPALRVRATHATGLRRERR